MATDWIAINELASGSGAHLVTFSSGAEHEFFYDRLGAAVIGLSAAPGSSSFAWSTGEPVGFTNWGTSQCSSGPYPNNPVTDRRFVVLNFGPCVGSAGLRPAWDDYPRSQLGPSVSNIGLEWSADCNSDGIVDYGQILDGTFPDANGNGVPDCCDGGESCTPCPGDVVRDELVDGVDLAAVLSQWGTQGSGTFNADIDNSGLVDGGDLAMVLAGWGPCP